LLQKYKTQKQKQNNNQCTFTSQLFHFSHFVNEKSDYPRSNKAVTNKERIRVENWKRNLFVASFIAGAQNGSGANLDNSSPKVTCTPREKPARDIYSIIFKRNVYISISFGSRIPFFHSRFSQFHQHPPPALYAWYLIELNIN